MKCAIYVMDKPGNSFGRLYSGKEMAKPAIDCDNPDMAVMKRVCSGWVSDDIQGGSRTFFFGGRVTRWFRSLFSLRSLL